MKSMSRTNTKLCFILTAKEKCTLVEDSTYILTKLMKVKGTKSWCMLEEYVKENYFARFHTHNYHCCSEMHFSSRLAVNFDKVSGA